MMFGFSAEKARVESRSERRRFFIVFMETNESGFVYRQRGILFLILCQMVARSLIEALGAEVSASE